MEKQNKLIIDYTKGLLNIKLGYKTELTTKTENM